MKEQQIIEDVLGQIAIYCFQILSIAISIGGVYWIIRYLWKGI